MILTIIIEENKYRSVLINPLTESLLLSMEIPFTYISIYLTSKLLILINKSTVYFNDLVNRNNTSALVYDIYATYLIQPYLFIAKKNILIKYNYVTHNNEKEIEIENIIDMNIIKNTKEYLILTKESLLLYNEKLEKIAGIEITGARKLFFYSYVVYLWIENSLVYMDYINTEDENCFYNKNVLFVLP